MHRRPLGLCYQCQKASICFLSFFPGKAHSEWEAACHTVFNIHETYMLTWRAADPWGDTMDQYWTLKANLFEVSRALPGHSLGLRGAVAWT